MKGDLQKNFYQKILEATQNIGRQARKGSGNYVVVNSNLAKYFLSLNQLRVDKIDKILSIIWIIFYNFVL